MREYIQIVETQLNELVGFKGTNELSKFKQLQTATNDPNGYASTNRAMLLKGFIDYLEQNGYTSLGRGNYAIAFTHPGLSYAVKIFKDDPAYMGFLNFCLANQGNAALPKLRGKFMSIDGENYVVRMELLKRLENPKTIIDLLSMFVRSMKSADAFGAVFKDQEREIIDQNPELLPTIEKIKALIKGSRYRFDLTTANIMQREDGTIVITDPLVG